MASSKDMIVQLKLQNEQFTRKLTESNASLKSIEKQANDVGSAFSKMGSAIKLSIAVLAGGQIAGFVKEVTQLAGRYEEMGIAMVQAGKNAGYSADQMTSYQKALQSSGISMLESRKVLTQLAAAHIDLSKSSQLARAAQDLAVVSGANSSETFQRLAYAIQSGSIEMLRTSGLNVTFEQGYQKTAQTLGKTTASLTEQEKTMSRLNTVLEASTSYTGLYEQAMTSASKQMRSLERYVEDFKVKLGEAFQPAYLSIVLALTDTFKQLGDYVSDADFQNSLKEIGNAFAEIGRVAIQVLVPAVKAAGSALQSFVEIGKGLGIGLAQSLYGADDALGKMDEKIADAKKQIAGQKENWFAKLFMPDTWKAEMDGFERKLAALEKMRETMANQIARERNAANAPAGKPAANVPTVDMSSEALRKFGLTFDQATSDKERKKIVDYYEETEKMLIASKTKYAEATAKTDLDKLVIKEKAEVEQAELTAQQKGIMGEALEARISAIHAKYVGERKELEIKTEWEILDARIAAQESLAKQTPLEKALAGTGMEEELEKMRRERMETTTGGDLKTVAGRLQQEHDLVLANHNERVEQEVALEIEKNEKMIKLTESTAEAMEKNFSGLFLNVMQGKMSSFSDFAKGIFESIQKSAADYLGMIATNFLFGEQTKDTGRKGGILGGLLGGAEGGGGGIGDLLGGIGSIFGGIFHGGGVVGKTLVPNMLMPAEVFAGARRYHGGLASDEMPAILQKGETVIPAGKSAGGGGQFLININAVDARSFSDMASRNPNAIIGPFMTALQKGGTLRNAIREVT